MSQFSVVLFLYYQEYLKALHDRYEDWLGNSQHHYLHGNTPVLVSWRARCRTRNRTVKLNGNGKLDDHASQATWSYAADEALCYRVHSDYH